MTDESDTCDECGAIVGGNPACGECCDWVRQDARAKRHDHEGDPMTESIQACEWCEAPASHRWVRGDYRRYACPEHVEKTERLVRIDQGTRRVEVVKSILA